MGSRVYNHRCPQHTWWACHLLVGDWLFRFSLLPLLGACRARYQRFQRVTQWENSWVLGSSWDSRTSSLIYPVLRLLSVRDQILTVIDLACNNNLLLWVLTLSWFLTVTMLDEYHMLSHVRSVYLYKRKNTLGVLNGQHSEYGHG